MAEASPLIMSLFYFSPSLGDSPSFPLWLAFISAGWRFSVYPSASAARISVGYWALLKAFKLPQRATKREDWSLLHCQGLKPTATHFVTRSQFRYCLSIVLDSKLQKYLSLTLWLLDSGIRVRPHPQKLSSWRPHDVTPDDGISPTDLMVCSYYSEVGLYKFPEIPTQVGTAALNIKRTSTNPS